MKIVIPSSSYQLLRSFSLHLFFKGMSSLIVEQTVRITGPRDSFHYALIVRYILVILLLLLNVALPILMIVLIGYGSWRWEDSLVGAVAAWACRTRSYLVWGLNILKVLHSIMCIISCKSTENAFETVSQLSNGRCPFLFSDRISDWNKRLVFSSLDIHLDFRVKVNRNLLLHMCI
jgi:hypothetical protein